MAAQDAELQLKVSLDLTFFKQQLAGLGSSAAGYRLPINIKFDRLSVQKELNALGNNIKKRTYRLDVNTNLKAEIDNASKLAKALDELAASRKAAQSGINQQLGLGILLGKPTEGGLGSKDVEKLYRAAARAGLIAYNKEVLKNKATAVAALEEVGADSVRGLLNGLNSEDEKLKAAATYLGESLIKTVKNVLGIASPSREFKKIGQNVGEGFQQGMMSSMDKAFDAVEGLMRARMKVLDTIARGMFRMAGVDPAVIRAEAAQRRALPGVNFPATVPPRNIPIGPSGTGRALPPGAIPSALPGTAFGSQKYLPTGLSDEMQRIMRSAAYTFVDSVKQQIRSVRIGLGASQQPLLGASRIAGLLPSGVGRAPSVYSTGAIGGETRVEMMARREREARMRSDLRGMDVMGGGAGRPPSPYSYAYRGARPTSAIVPYAAGGAIVPQPSMARGGGGGMQPPGGGGGGGAGGFGGFGRALGSVPNLPGTGTIRELGGEFAFATKQVLLFGQAYKLLGILQDFPAQVGAAVGQLQSFRNTLGAIAPTAEEARASNELILDLMNRYNVPLQSARDGFTKLYASMAPAGFSGDEIRELFTGITKAAATFGMSADKVDRVNYAFAQMASKGQIMSEELKGQLGDVLPGAMALFAEAAGFEGPKAIQDFSAALEDGAYKGEAMVALLKNVGIVMNQEFGPGAEGAARTFQGVINRMQNSMTLLYESFEPVAVGFLNNVVVPMTNGIKQLSDGLNAFFTGTAAKTAGGFAIAEELERLRPAFNGIGQNVQKLVPVFQQFANTALGIAKILLEIASNPFVGYLGRIYASVLPLTIAIQALNLQALVPMIANFLRAIPAFVAYTAATAKGVTANKALQLSMQLTGSTAAKTAVQIRSVGVAIKAAFTGTLVLAAVAGIGMIIEKIISLNAQMADTRAKALGAAQAIRAMSQTEARQAAQQYEAGAQSLRALNEQVEQGKMKGKAWIEVTGQQAKALQDAGIIVSNVRGSLQVQPTRVSGAFQKLEGLAAEARYRERGVAFAETEAQAPAVLSAIPGVESDGTGAGKKPKELDEYNQSQLDFIQQRFDKEKQILDQQLQLNLLSKTSYDIKLAELTLETKKAELNERFRLESEKINKANFSAADKALALKDEEIKKENAIAFAEKQRDIAVKGAKLELRQPFVEALRSENLEIDKQNALLGRLKEGYSALTPEQEASFIIEEKIAALKADEQRSIQSDIDNLKRQIQLRLENLKILEKEEALRSARQELGTIGSGLMAGFAGSAANVFERTMIATEGDVAQATKLAEIETKAMQMRSVFEGLQGAIDGISGAFASMMTEGVTALVTGTATAKEVFASFLQSVAQALQQAAAQMIATYVAIGIAKMFAGFSGGAGKGLDTSGFKQYPILPTPSAKGSYFDGPTAFFANGGIVSSPTFFQFADGGKMNMGLMGEAGPEAIMPLKRGPDGRLGISMYDASRKAVANAESNTGISSIDYEDDDSIGGTPSSRQALSSRAAQAVVATRLQVMEQRSLSEKRSEMRQIEEMIAMPAKINVEYQSQVINNVEYVTRDQAERMASQSALRGRELAIGALQNSVKTRKRVGMG